MRAPVARDGEALTLQVSPTASPMSSSPPASPDPHEQFPKLEHAAATRPLKGEDRCNVLRTSIGGEEVLLAAVLDGHGGSQAAAHCARELLPSIAQCCRNDPCVS